MCVGVCVCVFVCFKRKNAVYTVHRGHTLWALQVLPIARLQGEMLPRTPAASLIEPPEVVPLGNFTGGMNHFPNGRILKEHNIR